MRFGIFDQSEQPSDLNLSELYASRFDLLERADKAGFWGYHKSEHHLIPLDHAPSIGLYLAAAAQRTTNIRLCSLVHLLPFYHPIRLIEEVCMLDHLTGGRFELGFGKGISAPEHQLWGLDPAEAVERTDETLELLLAALTCPDERFSFSGKFHQLDNIPLEVRPLQQPHPPLWRPGTVDTAAQLGVSTVVGGPIAHVHASIEKYRANYQPGLGGAHEPTVGAIRKIIVAPTDAEADELGRKAWPAYSDHLAKLFREFDCEIPNDPTVGGDYEVAKQFNVVVVGSPERIRAHIDELCDEGLVEYVIGCFAFGNLSHDEVVRSQELFAEHVVAPLAS